MTVESTTNREQYGTNGTTGPWTVPWQFYQKSDVLVIHTDANGNETELADADYSVTGTGDEAGGTVTTTTAYASGGYITLLMNFQALQETDYTETDSFPAETHERALDLLTRLVQQVKEVSNRSLVFSPSDTDGSSLPAASVRANKLLGFDSLGRVSVAAPVSGSAAALAISLASSASATEGAGQVGYSYLRSYAPGTIGAALKGYLLNVKTDFGAVGDGSTNDTAAMTAAHATGNVIFYPPGRYKFDPTITFSSGGIVGAGPLLTTLYCAGTGTENLFKFTGALGSYSNIPTFEGFTIEANPSKTNGAGIQFQPATGETSYINFNNVHTLFCPIGIDFVAASLWKVQNCAFLSYTVAGIQVANTNSADSGDSVVMGCVFNNPFTTGSGVWQKSSGGLKILGNKFLGGERAYTMALEDSTSVLVISGNSMENMAGADIALTRAVAGKAFVNVVITGNEFSVGGVAIATDSNAFLTEVNISANQINMGAVGSNACIALNNVTDFFVGSNIIKGNGGAGSSGVNITNCTNGKIGINTYANLPTPIVISGSPTVSYELDEQSGTVTTSTSGWGAYGSLYLGPATTVTFAREFLMTPAVSDCFVQPIAANGELGAVVVSVSKTQLVFRTVSAINAIGAQMKWTVRGVL